MDHEIKKVRELLMSNTLRSVNRDILELTEIVQENNDVNTKYNIKETKINKELVVEVTYRVELWLKDNLTSIIQKTILDIVNERENIAKSEKQ